MSFRTLTAGVTMAVLACAALTACGGSSNNPTSPSSAATSASITPVGTPKQVKGEQIGSLLLAGLTGARSAVVKAIAPSTETLVVHTAWGSSPAFTTRLGSDDQAGTLMGVGKDVYLAKPTRPGKWMQVDLAGKDASSSTVLPLLFGLFMQDPASVPTLLKGAQGSCTSYSDGSQRCEFPLTSTAFAAQTSAVLSGRGVSQAIIAQYLKSVGAPNAGALTPMVVVLDSQNRPTKIENPQPTSATDKAKVEVEGWGSAVAAARPQPNSVMPADQWIGQ